MSDTPKTDAECGWRDQDEWISVITGGEVRSDFARELERENARLRAALETIQCNDPETNRQHADEIANRALANVEVYND